MESTTFFGYQVEIDRAATSAWYASAKEWGCECGDCRHYVALAKERRLPPDMMALLDSLGIPLEKATYVCSLYKTEEGILYQVSYRVAGNILSATEHDKNAFGRCIHETYPYGAPDFPQPHFDVEFYPTLPYTEEN